MIQAVKCSCSCSGCNAAAAAQRPRCPFRPSRQVEYLVRAPYWRTHTEQQPAVLTTDFASIEEQQQACDKWAVRAAAGLGVTTKLGPGACSPTQGASPPGYPLARPLEWPGVACLEGGHAWRTAGRSDRPHQTTLMRLR